MTDTVKHCGGCGSGYRGAECPHCPSHLSGGSGSMDAMIQQASVPNLAALFKAGKKAGVIKSVPDYGAASAPVA